MDQSKLSQPSTASSQTLRQRADRLRLSLESSSGTYFLGLLFLVSVFNFLDRQVLSIVQEQIKVDLSLTDGQLGYLALGFGLMHAACALPIGRLADRVPRKTVLVGCLTIWSSFTVFCGLAINYVHLLLMRMGVAFGEAGVTPTTYSLISDKFPLKRRATAISICSAGIPVGLMLSLFLGGIIAENFGWRLTFVVFGLPGILLALVFYFTVKAPQRGEADGIKQVSEASFQSTFTHLLATRTFLLVLIGSGVKAFATNSVLQWMPSFYIRKFDLSMAEVGVTLGPIIGIVGLVSLVGASYMADRLSEKDIRWYSWIITAAMITAFPFLYFSLVSGNYVLSLIFFGFAIFCGNSMLGISNALIQSTAPVQMRGMASAMKTVALSFVGYGIGGAAVGQLSDYFATGVPGEGLQTALVIASITHLIAGAFFWMSASSLRRDVDAAKKSSSAG